MRLLQAPWGFGRAALEWQPQGLACRNNLGNEVVIQAVSVSSSKLGVSSRAEAFFFDQRYVTSSSWARRPQLAFSAHGAGSAAMTESSELRSGAAAKTESCERRSDDVGATNISDQCREECWPATNVLIPDPELLAKKKSAMRRDGAGLLQVIADFDLTLTKFKVNGQRGQSTHAVLSQNKEIDARRHELYQHYFPIEHDPHIPYEEKFKLMEEWWSKSHGLILEAGLTYSDIKASVSKANIAFRENTVQLLETLDKKRVPTLIFSAGLADIIEEVLRQRLHRVFGNVRVVSNRMNFDEEGKLTGFQGRTIHVLNKNEHALEMAGPLHDEAGHTVDDLAASSAGADNNGQAIVAGRTNVILLGDHVGDLGMSEGVNLTQRISVGFLNDQIDKNMELFKKSFDIIILDDGPMDYVVDLVSSILD